MGLLSRFRSKSGEQERPPKPDPEVIERTGTVTVYDYEFVYHNGDTDIIEGHSLRLADGVYRVKAVTARPSVYAIESPTKFTVPVDVLAARPSETPIETFVIDYTKTTDYHWDRLLGKWAEKTHPDIEIVNTEREPIEDDSDV